MTLREGSRLSISSDVPIWRDERVLRGAAQLISAMLMIGALIWLVTNFIQAAEQRGLPLSYDFLSQESGFPIGESVIEYDPSRPFLYAFLVGLLNTLKVSLLGIILATVLGTGIALARMSSNWLLSRLALAYIEFFRNTPLLVLLFIWYFAVFNRFPRVRDSIALPGPIYLNQRGLFIPWPKYTTEGLVFLAAILLGIITATVAWIVLRRIRERTGRQTYFPLVSLFLLLLFPALAWNSQGGQTITWDIPLLEGFNFKGGTTLTPEFAALLVGLVTYTAAFIAEVVRSGIQAVDRGQREAASAIGLSNAQVLSLVVIPQAMRVMIPPMISQFLNLTKNSSLALAIGYPDLFAVGRIMINQAGRAVPVFSMVMLTYLAISLFTSLVLNLYNRKIQYET
ncbi:MAG: ABC transporter permease subunit [Anaerolineae bacterium]|nr:MAG: ABC transporter permease subunit [Anaerolineae bacterium]